MRRRPPRTAMVAVAALAAVAVAVGANLLLIDRAPAVDPLGRLNPSVVTVDVQGPAATDGVRTQAPPVRTETERGRTETERTRTDSDDHGGGDHDDDD